LPANLDPESRSVLYYQIAPDKAVDLTWRVEINDSIVSEHTMIGSAFRTMHELVSASLLRQEDNRIFFRLDMQKSVSGKLTISDAVLFWQNDLAE
jgi:hypothetical protein